jgi:hypothetical protein
VEGVPPLPGGCAPKLLFLRRIYLIYDLYKEMGESDKIAKGPLLIESLITKIRSVMV